jgi:DNA-binding response OmpR family regulator/Tfp pilus assembly protein PilZ
MNPRILVVEDEPLLQSMMRDILETLPATVIEARDGEEALRLVRKEQPNLIILDIMMPGLTGYDVAEALKDDAWTAEIPIIFLSAIGTPDQKVRGLELGADDFLTKPVDPNELRARVRAILRRIPPVTSEAPTPRPSVASGQLQAMSLSTLARSMELDRRSARLVFTKDREIGEVVFASGRITRAFQGPRKGDAAMYHLLTWEEGGFDMLPYVEGASPAGGEVIASNEVLLQEGARRLEEISSLLAGLPGAEALLEVPESVRVGMQGQLSPEAAGLVSLLDGTQSLDQVVVNSPFDAWMTLTVLHRLLRVGALGWNVASTATKPAVGSEGQAATPRRTVPRLTVDGPIQYQSLQAFRQAPRFTLSARGLFIQTGTPSEVGEKVLVRFQLPGVAAWITAVGQVVWRKAEAQKGRQAEQGMSVQLVEVPAEYLGAIEERLTQSIAASIREVVGPKG